MYHHFSPSENSSDVTRNFAYQKERCLRPSRFLNKPLYEEVEAHASTGAGRNYRSNASPFFFHVVASIGTHQGSLRHSACGARGKCTGLLLVLRKIPSQIFKVKIYSGTDNFKTTLRQVELHMYFCITHQQYIIKISESIFKSSKVITVQHISITSNF